MSSSKPTSDFEIALERFDLRRWLEQHGFEAQGRQRVEYVHDCPWCGEEEKLSVNVVTKKRRCFVCQRPFSILDLVAVFEGGYAQAAETIRLAAGVRSIAVIPEADLRPHMGVVREAAWEPWPIHPPEHYEPLVDHVPYTARRGFSLENMRALGVGICTWGFYQDRLVFPVRRADGAWVYFQSRATWERDEHVGPRKYRKNLNPPNEDPSRFASASDVLLGLDVVVRGRFSRVAIVEGPTDWLQAGPAAVATFGKTLSDRHVQLLVRAGVREVDLCYDPDAWEPPTRRLPDGRVELTGRPAPAKVAADRLSQLFTTRIVRYAPGVDPGKTSVEDNWAMRMAAPTWGDGSRLRWIP